MPSDRQGVIRGRRERLLGRLEKGDDIDGHEIFRHGVHDLDDISERIHRSTGRLTLSASSLPPLSQHLVKHGLITWPNTIPVNCRISSGAYRRQMSIFLISFKRRFVNVDRAVRAAGSKAGGGVAVDWDAEETSVTSAWASSRKAPSTAFNRACRE